MRLLIVSSVLLLTLVSTLSFVISFEESTNKINGVNLVSPSKKFFDKKNLDEVAHVGAKWVAIIPYAFSHSGHPNVSFDHERQWWGERSEGIRSLITFSKKRNLNVMLKPHVWVRGQGWTGDYVLNSEKDWKIWEKEYTKYILNYAKIADSMNVSIFCIGTEYRVPARERPDFWITLINQIKTVYKGKLTYAANWDNYQNISWWKELDYIGIDAYFPLETEHTPSIVEIKSGWDSVSVGLEKISRKWDKPILFTEYGFQNLNYAAGKHWEIKKSIDNRNDQAQKNAYQATFMALWDKKWFAGGFLWKWHLTNLGIKKHVVGFTPQGKPTQEIIRIWYK